MHVSLVMLPKVLISLFCFNTGFGFQNVVFLPFRFYSHWQETELNLKGLTTHMCIFMRLKSILNGIQ